MKTFSLPKLNVFTFTPVILIELFSLYMMYEPWRLCSRNPEVLIPGNSLCEPNYEFWQYPPIFALLAGTIAVYFISRNVKYTTIFFLFCFLVELLVGIVYPKLFT